MAPFSRKENRDVSRLETHLHSLRVCSIRLLNEISSLAHRPPVLSVSRVRHGGSFHAGTGAFSAESRFMARLAFPRHRPRRGLEICHLQHDRELALDFAE